MHEDLLAISPLITIDGVSIKINDTDAERPAFGPLATFISTANVIVALGLLVLPYGFRMSGYVLGSAAICVVAFCSCVTMLLLVEAISRAEAIERVKHIIEGGGTFRRPPERADVYYGSSNRDSGGGGYDGYDHSGGNDGLVSFGDEILRMSHVCRIFGGQMLQAVWNVCAFVLCFGNMVFLTGVLGFSILSLVKHPFDDVYIVCVVCFGLLMVALILLTSIKVQVLFQLVLALIASAACVALGVAVGIRHDKWSTSSVPEFVGPKWPLISALAALSFCTHAHVSSLTSVLQRQASSRTVYGMTFFAVAVVYILVGLVASFYLGEDISKLLPLSYTAYEVTSFMSVLMLVIPIVNIVASYPFHAITAGNVLFSIVHHFVSNRRRPSRRDARAACVLLSTLFAIFFRDMTGLLMYMGGVACLVSFALPAVIHLRSSSMIALILGSDLLFRPFSGWFGSRIAVLLMMVFGLGSAAAAFFYRLYMFDV